MSRPSRVVIAILAAGAALYVGGWFDGTVMRDIQHQEDASFDPNGLALALSLGSLAVAGAVLLLGSLAWRSRSTLVGATYSSVGAVVAFLPVIVWRLAAQINNTPPVLPKPIADEVSQIYFWSNGPLNAMGTIGAGILVAGILVIGRSFRGRVASRTAESSAEPAVLPAQP